MPSLRDLRRRIRTVANTQKITKAMQLVAAAKLRRAQERMENARPYADELTSVSDFNGNTITIGNTTSNVAPNTDVSQGPRNGLRHRIRESPGGGWLSSARHSTAGNP